MLDVSPTDNFEPGQPGGGEAPPVGGGAGVGPRIRARHGGDHQRPVSEHLQPLAPRQLLVT